MKKNGFKFKCKCGFGRFMIIHSDDNSDEVYFECPECKEKYKLIDSSNYISLQTRMPLKI